MNKKHIGSTVALILGALSLFSPILEFRPGGAGTPPSATRVIMGLVIILGALAYRSAKKRGLGEVKNSLLRKGLEATAIVVILAVVLLQNDLVKLIETDPVPNLIVSQS